MLDWGILYLFTLKSLSYHLLFVPYSRKKSSNIRCQYKVHYFVEILDEFNVRYFVSDADTSRGSSF